MEFLIKIWNAIISVLCKSWNELSKEPANNVLDTDVPEDSTVDTPEEK